MLIGVVSDTHLTDGPIPEFLIDAFRDVDMILHAGDILEMPVLDQLSGIADTFAVKGNMDHGDVARVLPAKRIIEVEGFKIGLTHGFGAPTDMISKVGAQFDDVDCIVFGHTHTPFVKEEEGVLYFNPGTPTDRIFTDRNSLGYLEITDRIEPRIIDIGSL